MTNVSALITMLPALTTYLSSKALAELSGSSDLLLQTCLSRKLITNVYHEVWIRGRCSVCGARGKNFNYAFFLRGPVCVYNGLWCSTVCYKEMFVPSMGYVIRFLLAFMNLKKAPGSYVTSLIEAALLDEEELGKPRYNRQEWPMLIGRFVRGSYDPPSFDYLPHDPIEAAIEEDNDATDTLLDACLIKYDLEVRVTRSKKKRHPERKVTWRHTL